MSRHTRHWNDRAMTITEVEKIFEVQIRPCPFCGSSLLGLVMGPNSYVTCGNCGADGPIVYAEELRDSHLERQRVAVGKWNVRHHGSVGTAVSRA